MYREPSDSMANEVLYNIPCDLVREVILRHEDVDRDKRGAQKRKNTSVGREELRRGVEKRIRKMEQVKAPSKADKPSQPGSSKTGART